MKLLHRREDTRKIRSAKRSLRWAAALSLSLASSCGPQGPHEANERLPPPAQTTAGAVREYESCIDELLETGLPSRINRPSQAIAQEEISRTNDELERSLRKAGRDEALGVYLEHFRSARFSNGESIYPGVAQTLEGDISLTDRKRIETSRKVVIAIGSKRIRMAHELIAQIPRTSIALLASMELEDAEDMSGLLSNAVEMGARLHTRDGKVVRMDGPASSFCGKIHDGTYVRMTKAQLQDFDALYSALVAGFMDSVRECAVREYSGFGGTWISCNTVSRSEKNLCDDLSRRQASGELINFGIPDMPLPCTENLREDACGSPYSFYGRDGDSCMNEQKRRVERWLALHPNDAGRFKNFLSPP